MEDTTTIVQRFDKFIDRQPQFQRSFLQSLIHKESSNIEYITIEEKMKIVMDITNRGFLLIPAYSGMWKLRDNVKFIYEELLLVSEDKFPSWLTKILKRPPNTPPVKRRRDEEIHVIGHSDIMNY